MRGEREGMSCYKDPRADHMITVVTPQSYQDGDDGLLRHCLCFWAIQK